MLKEYFLNLRIIKNILKTLFIIYVLNFFIDIDFSNRPKIYKSHRANLIEFPQNFSQTKIATLDLKYRSIDDFKGKPTIIMFWATWCGSCAKELPKIAKFYDQYKDYVNIVPISINEKPKDIVRFYKKNKGGQLSSYLGIDSSLHKPLKIKAVPSFVLLDKNSNAVAKLRPRWHRKDVMTLIEQLIEDSQKDS